VSLIFHPKIRNNYRYPTRFVVLQRRVPASGILHIRPRIVPPRLPARPELLHLPRRLVSLPFSTEIKFGCFSHTSSLQARQSFLS
jgi:hypothetical protein